MASQVVVEMKNVSKEYKQERMILQEVSLQFESGKMYAIMGRSGAGKTTLLNLLGTMDEVTEGNIFINGEDITSYNEAQKAEIRTYNIGFVFQEFHLNPYISVCENVILPMRINKKIAKADRRKRALDLLKEFGVEMYEKELPGNLSGGEQQRVCIARALANNPCIILADEPTGNLDAENEHQVFKCLKRLAAEGRTIICVSHNEAIKEYADEVIELL